MENLIIRKATAKDFEGILNLAISLYETERPFDKNIKEGYYQTDKGSEELLKSIRARKKIFLVAEVDDKIVGFCDGYILDKDNVYIEKVAYLDRLCVDFNYRKNGVGARLIDEFTNIVKTKNAKFIKLNAFEGNIPAIELYKKSGFKEYSIYYMKDIK